MYDENRVSCETLSVSPTSMPCFYTKPVSPLDSLYSVFVEGLQQSCKFLWLAELTSCDLLLSVAPSRVHACEIGPVPPLVSLIASEPTILPGHAESLLWMAWRTNG